ncbi:MAG: transketolase [Oscillospiraceae bacterium]|nr:transketolase [Oscillospiraceae bacterium]
MDKGKSIKLELTAARVRKSILGQVFAASSGHPGGSLSCADMLTYLYFHEMEVDPAKPRWEGRDRFVLSKGHCSPALYAVLAERGFFPKDDLKGFRSADSYLEGHPSMKSVPGVDMSTGSLGQGISAAVGMAIAGKLYGEGFRVYAMIGDGESEEGQVWEAFMCAAHYKLDNLCCFLDYNGLQIDGSIKDVVSPEPFAEKYRAFGWNVVEIDGHDFAAIERAALEARACVGRPTAVVAATVKGKGVSYMENQAGWHGAAPNAEQYATALAELDAAIAGLGGANGNGGDVDG